MGLSKQKRGHVAPSYNGQALGYVEVTLTNAQIKALRATPVTIIPAQGTGTLIELLALIVELKAGTNAITVVNTGLAAKYNNGTGQAATATVTSAGLMDQTVDTLAVVPVAAVAAVASTAALNLPIVLHNTGSAEFLGNAANDALVKVKAAYRIHTNL